MKSAYKFLIRLFLFWMALFASHRLLFLLYELNNLSGIPWAEVVSTFFHALRLDASAACYLISISFLILIFQTLFPMKILNIAQQVIAGTGVTIYSAITASEFGIFDSWGTKLNYEAISHLMHPSEIYAITPYSLLAALSGYILLTVCASWFLYKRYVYIPIDKRSGRWYSLSAFLLLTPGILLLGIRGGTYQIPINVSDAWFSKHTVLNTAAVNNGWNVIHSIVQNQEYLEKNPYLTVESAQARKIIADLYTYPEDTVQRILNIEKPNIIVVILESWSADMIEELGGLTGITPNFSRLCKEGLLFTRCHAVGNLSHEGMLAIFSGFPSQPTTSLIKQPDKFIHLPCFARLLKSEGYNSSAFYYGGQLTYGNIRSYIIFNLFDKIIEGDDFPSGTPSNKLTVHDEYLFSRAIGETALLKEPFLAVVYTGSSHAPYMTPMKQRFNIGDNWDETGYVNAVYYADSCIGIFMNRAKKEHWYENSLFLFVADHSHQSPLKRDYYSPEYRKIPLLIAGPALRHELQGKRIEKIGSQIDIPATLLSQLGIGATEFRWSKNLLNSSTPEFAYFSFVDGVGWIRPWGSIAYDKPGNLIRFLKTEDSTKTDAMLTEGNAYLQTVFQEYLDY